MKKTNKLKSEREKATFAAGCFWRIQEMFDKVPGVVKTIVGYTGGKEEYKNPSYEEVCSDVAGHAEAIEIEFDTKKINYEKLLELFWRCHNPTTLNRQGHDVGSQYRPVVFYHNEKQKKLAEKSKKKAQKNFEKHIVTKIVKAGEFYPAEEYHQKYYKTHRISCPVVDLKELG